MVRSVDVGRKLHAEQHNTNLRERKHHVPTAIGARSSRSWIVNPAEAARIAALRDRLIELEDRWGTSLDFRLAIDIGTVMASTVGTDPPSRNLWGGAIGIAKVLAGTTARRTIAASETAYDMLSNQFLFRPRGSYFLPETGNMRTFVMVGRI